MSSTPPVAKRVPTTRTHHGDTFEDPYEWLREKESPETLAHLEAENAWTAERTDHLQGLREQIFEEIKARTQETDLSVPYRIGGYWYYGRSVEGQQYGSSCRCPVSGPEDWSPPELDPGSPVPDEETLLDLDALAEGTSFFSVGAVSVSPDCTKLAYSTDTVGDERFLLRVKDLGTGSLLPDEIPGTLGGVVWDLAGSVVFYTTVDDAWRVDKVWRHVLGTPVADDVLVHHESDERFTTSIGRTRSNRFLVIASGSRTTTEYALLEADDPTGEFRIVAPRRAGVEYAVEHAVLGGTDVLLVLHNEDAVNSMLSVAPVTSTSHEEWTPLLEHDPAVRLEQVDAFAGHLVVSQRRAGLTELRVVVLDDEAPHGLGEDFAIDFGEPLYSVGAGSNREFAQPTVRLGFATLATPAGVYDYDVTSRELTLLKASPVLPDPSGRPFDPADYHQRREWAQAEDGTAVPISIITPANAPTDQPLPMLLYGYGSYEISMDPWFSVARLSLLDRGVGFAIAHVRGGGEMGRPWYDEGKLASKPNTFTDFIACARHLVEIGLTTADQVVAEGGSAGGLLVGAAVTMAPESFAGVLAEVPFVDPLTTILDPSLPLTVGEWEEWGNPVEDPDIYAVMKGYSPYENVAARRYPPILATTSLHDTRVYYVEPAKWVARLREVAVETDEVLLKTEMSGGHGGVSGRYNRWRETAFNLAWVLDRLGRA